MTTSALFQWPDAAAVGRVIPKRKILDEVGASASLRRRFTDEVAKIGWEYKLAPETIGLPAGSDVPEVQVITLYAKADDVTAEVIAAIGRAIHQATVFEVERTTERDGREIRMAVAHGTTGSGRASAARYHSTGWVPADRPRVQLPPAVDLSGLHAQLIAAVLPTARREGEPIEAVIDRTAEIRRLERDVARLSAKMRAEPQFNRQVELRREIRALEHRLVELGADQAPAIEER